MKSIQLYARIKELRAEAAAIPEDAETRADQLMEIQGRISELTTQLGEALQAEDEAREAMQAAAAPVGGSVRPKSLMELAFGPRSEFKGIEPGFKAAITVPAGPDMVDPTIPLFPDGPRGFADSLVQAPTSGAVTFLRRVSKTNAAAQWKDADGAKPESAYVWEEVTAPLTWIAHHAPIAKTQASDWGQLQSIVENEMMVGLSQAKSTEALVGENASGITGVINTTGILTYDPSSDGAETDTVYDSIRRAATRVFLTSGFRPDKVAVTPQVREELDLLKGTDGHYLAINVGNQVWGLEIVEDTGLTITDETHVHNGFIVYASLGGTWYTKESNSVEIGLVDDQFIKNAYTLLAEGRNALAVRFPDAFCYCEDAITAVAVEGS